MLAGWVKNGAPLGIGDDARLLLKPGDVSMGWLVTFALMALIFMGAFAYHRRVLPHPSSDSGLEKTDVKVLANELWLTIKCFFSKPQILAALAFMLLFRFPEAMLVKLASPFMLDGLESGGLGLDTAEVGFVYGTVGVVGLTLGGILGGMAVSRGGLKRWLWPMVLAISFPDAVYIYLSYFQESGMFVISSCVFVEQFGYGFGFTAYMLYLIYFSRGEKSTSVYAFCTGLMALGMMLPGMMAGWIQEQIGYRMFFVLVMVCTLITVAVSGLLKIDPEFGRKKN
jgi:PAT family beta-lactamase induction signal transducer AmpG